jgi:uncharacterized damage-inducible protein DinB
MNPGHPEPNEYAPFFAGYVAKADGVTDPIEALETQLNEAIGLLLRLDEAEQNHAYAPGKWTIKELVNHMTDAERIFAYRALRIARKDQTPLAPFDENPYVSAAEPGRIEWQSLMTEFVLVRKSTLQMLRNFPEAAWIRIGIASQVPISVRAMVFIMYGHVAHHLGIIRERYLVAGS